MVFRYELTVTTDHTRDTPANVQMYVARGIIHGLDICFPPGCAGWVHTHVCLRETQMWPLGGTEDFAWDWYVLEIRNEEVAVLTPPYLLQAYAWTEDDTHEHTLTYRIYERSLEPPTFRRWLARTMTRDR